MWRIVEEKTKPTKEEILVALCRQMKGWEKMSYLLFEEDAVKTAGFALEQTNGKTGDNLVDVSDLHCQIRGLTAKKVCVLLLAILRLGCETGEFKRGEYDAIILRGYDEYKGATRRVETPNATVSPTRTAANSSTEQLVPEPIGRKTMVENPAPGSSSPKSSRPLPESGTEQCHN